MGRVCLGPKGRNGRHVPTEYDADEGENEELRNDHERKVSRDDRTVQARLGELQTL